MSALAEDIRDDETAPPVTADAVDGWEKDGRGRRFTRPPGGGNVVFRRGNETVDEALERAARPDKDKKPPKPKKPPLPKKEATVDFGALEQVLAQMFTTPGDIAGALLDDEWLVLHFRARGPHLARVLINASEHNPWLRKKLIELSSGGAAAMQVQAMIMLAIAAAGYAIPPIAYWFRLEVPAMVQITILGGAIPQRPRPAPFQAQPQPPVRDASATAEAA